MDVLYQKSLNTLVHGGQQDAKATNSDIMQGVI